VIDNRPWWLGKVSERVDGVQKRADTCGGGHAPKDKVKRGQRDRGAEGERLFLRCGRRNTVKKPGSLMHEARGRPLGGKLRGEKSDI